MIKVRFLILLALLNFSIDSSAQSSIRKMSDCYKINGMICQQNLLQIENVSDENIWIFFEPDTTLTDNELILSRFKYKGEGDMSLYQWITDGEISVRNLTLCFSKYLRQIKNSILFILAIISSVLMKFPKNLEL